MENYEIVRRIGTGFNAWVELAVDKKTNEYVALKVFHNINTSPLQTNNIFINERQMLQKLERCKGIVKLNSWSTSQLQLLQKNIQNLRGLMQPTQPTPKYLVLEYHEKGDLLQYVLKSRGAFKENLCRRLFAQISEVISSIHKLGIVHRDIKLENILVGDEYDLCIADLGFACVGFDDKGIQKKLNDFLGSMAYAAPEMFLGDPYSGVQTDIFQLGVCLFILAYGNLPFQRAHPQDDLLYKLIARNRWQKFWEYHDQKKQTVQKSEELKDLLMGMLNVNQQRIQMSQIQSHPWFSMEWSSQSQLIEELSFRYSDIQSNNNFQKNKSKIQFEEQKK